MLKNSYDEITSINYFMDNDLIEVKYKNTFDINNILEIKKLYSYTNNNFLGFIITSNNNRYESIKDINMSTDKGFRYIYSDGFTMYNHNFGLKELIIDTNYLNYKNYLLNQTVHMRVNLYISLFDLVKDPVIGLIYEKGIVYDDSAINLSKANILEFSGLFSIINI